MNFDSCLSNAFEIARKKKKPGVALAMPRKSSWVEIPDLSHVKETEALALRQRQLSKIAVHSVSRGFIKMEPSSLHHVVNSKGIVRSSCENNVWAVPRKG